MMEGREKEKMEDRYTLLKFWGRVKNRAEDEQISMFLCHAKRLKNDEQMDGGKRRKTKKSYRKVSRASTGSGTGVQLLHLPACTAHKCFMSLVHEGISISNTFSQNALFLCQRQEEKRLFSISLR